jgi:glycosyltransferase involved in cell wall biosynthesis
MKLGFYYHIPVLKKNNKLFVPGYLGVFLESLASNVEVLYLFMHECDQKLQDDADFELSPKNIIFINLGIITPAWHRHLFHKSLFNKLLTHLELCDFVIVRSPTPLAPFFYKYARRTRIIFMIVGDYLEGVRHFKIKSIRDWLMIQYVKRNDFLFRKVMSKTDVFVNSPSLAEKYTSICKSIHLIKTTTLRESDFFQRDNTCGNNIIELLYTGRIEAGKGLFELCKAVAKLKNKNKNVRLNIVGWEADKNKSVEAALKKMASELCIIESIIFHGKKKIGPELNEMYRSSDLFVLPSYHEGFPRTIWEAMANSLPVVTTRVGGIPDYLTNNENALFVEPKNVDELVYKIIQLIESAPLRIKLIKNGYLLAKDNTIQFQTSNMVKLIQYLN